MLSTYNGEQYLKKQILSIITQETVKIKLVVRDDGSTDNTKEILCSFASKYDNIEILFEENVGFVKSFTRLVNHVVYKYGKEYYFAFADQDDIWYPNKLITASTCLSRYSSETPSLFCSNSYLINSNNEIVGRFRKNYPRFTRGNVIFYGTFQGCSMVFNYAALKEYDTHPPILAYHDRWMYLICHFLGNVIYDNSPLFGYRIHESNVVGTKVKEDTIMQDLAKLHRKKKNQNRVVIERFVDCWGLRMKSSDLDNINVYFSYPESWISKMKLLFMPTFGPREISYRGMIGHFFRVCRNEL